MKNIILLITLSLALTFNASSQDLSQPTGARTLDIVLVSPGDGHSIMNFEQDIKNINYSGYTILKNFLNDHECKHYINLIEKYATEDYSNKIREKINKGWDGNWVHNLQNKDIEFLIEPYVRFKDEIGEQATMFFLDPSGNALEFKTFKDPDMLFKN